MTDEARLEHWMESRNDGGAEEFRARTFRSREIVWSAFETMARELETPIDDLVNEAMATYAETRGYPLGAQPPVRSDRAPVAGAAERSPTFEEDADDLVSTRDRPTLGGRASVPEHRAPEPRPPQGRAAMPRLPPRLPPSRPPLPPRGASAVPLPPPPPPSRGSAFAEVRQPPPRLAPPSVPSRVPPPPPSRQHAPPESRERYHSSPTSVRQLVLEYEGQAYPVEKERFLIGRSKAQSDLRLDDPNVSRQHAVIERVGAAWYIVDLGSTNGIRIAGERVARRALMDSDVITITTHEIRCFFRAG